MILVNTLSSKRQRQNLRPGLAFQLGGHRKPQDPGLQREPGAPSACLSFSEIVEVICSPCVPCRQVGLRATAQPGAQEHEHLYEVDVLLREEGGRQVHSRKKSSGSRKCCSSGARRFLECLISWRDHRHSGIRQVPFTLPLGIAGKIEHHRNTHKRAQMCGGSALFQSRRAVSRAGRRVPMLSTSCTL